MGKELAAGGVPASGAGSSAEMSPDNEPISAAPSMAQAAAGAGAEDATTPLPKQETRRFLMRRFWRTGVGFWGVMAKSSPGRYRRCSS